MITRADGVGVTFQSSSTGGNQITVRFRGAVTAAAVDTFVADVISDIEADGYTRDPAVPAKVKMRGSTASLFRGRHVKVLGTVPKKFSRSKTKSILDLTEVV